MQNLTPVVNKHTHTHTHTHTYTHVHTRTHTHTYINVQGHTHIMWQAGRLAGIQSTIIPDDTVQEGSVWEVTVQKRLYIP